MPASTATVTINVKDILGVNYSGRRTPITVRTNIPDETIVEKSSGNLRVGTGRVTMDESSGVATVEVWVPGAGTNPASWQTYFDLEYDDRAARAKKRKTYGPFTITGDVDLGDLIEEQAVPPAYLTTVTQQLDAKVAEAEVAAAQARDISNIDTTDDAVDAALKLPGSKSAATLSASIEQGVEPIKPANDARAVGQNELVAYAKNAGVDRTKTGAQNSAALTALVAAVGAFSAGPATIQLEGGVHDFASTVTLDVPGVRVRGEATTTLRASAAMTDGVLLATAANVRIENVSVDANAGLAQWGIHAKDTTGLRLRDVDVTGTKQHGLYLRDVNDVVLDTVTLASCGTAAGSNPAGMYASDCDNMTMRRVKATGAYQHGFYIISDGGFSLGVAKGLVMTECYALDNGDTGFSIRVSRLTMTGCYAWGNAHQAAALLQVGQTPSPYKGDTMVLTGCVLGGTTTNTVGNEVVVTADRVAVTGCVIDSSNTQNGLRFTGCADVTAVGNVIRATYASLVGALRVDGTSEYLIAANKIIGPGGSTSGIYVTASSDGTVSNNRITNFANGVRLDATASSNVAVMFNTTKTVTTPVSNSSTGTGVSEFGNGTQASVEANAPVRMTKGYATPPAKQTLAANGAVTIDASRGDAQITLNANATSSSITNPTDGQLLRISWVQDATGGRTYAWPTRCRFAGGSAPSDTTAGTRTTATFKYELFQDRWFEMSRAVAVPTA